MGCLRPRVRGTSTILYSKITMRVLWPGVIAHCGPALALLIQTPKKCHAGPRIQQGMASSKDLRARARQVMDMLVEQTHAIRHEVRSNERAMRFTDTRMDEQQRGVSLKMVPLSLVMAGGKGKSYLLNLIDTPGAP